MVSRSLFAVMIDLPEHIQRRAGNCPVSTGHEPHDEHARLTAALAAADGNISAAARLLGVDRSTVHRQLRRIRQKAAH